MSPAEVGAVAAAGAAGALVRYEITRGRPLVVLHAVNAIGALLLGLAVGGGGGGPAMAVALAGGLGGLTSFSTWMVGARDVARTSPTPGRVFVGHVVLPGLLAVAAAWVGTRLATEVAAAMPGGGA